MVRVLGRGGMGAVWLARDQRAEVEVAIKVVKASLVEDEAALTRFRREMKVMAGLSHDNIVRGLDAGEDSGVLWLAMELLHGETLRERLDARGRLPWQESLAVVRQISRGLGAAHRAGIVHRDLKPENIMLVPGAPDRGGDGDVLVKLLDFGVAKASQVEGGQSSMTGTGFIVGTPGYVAPEVVLEGKTNDPRTDFYALGVVWFEMVTGQKPFSAKTAFALAMRHAHERPPSFAEIAPFAPVPTPVENVVQRLMAKSPEERPPDADTLEMLVDGLEKGALAAAAGTPLPEAFEATLTDVRDAPNGTAIVPLKLTPTPRPSAPASLTPATGLAPTPGAASPSSGIHLFRQLPVGLKVLMLSGAVLLPLTMLGGVAWIAADRDGADETGGRPGPSGPSTAERLRGPPALAASDFGESGAIHGRASPPPTQEGKKIEDAGARLAGGLVPEVKEADGDAPAKANEAANARTQPQTGSTERPAKNPMTDRRTKNVAQTRPVEVAPPPFQGLGTWSLRVGRGKVRLELDGAHFDDPPILKRPIAAGEHQVRVLDALTGEVLLQRTFTVRAGELSTLSLLEAQP